MNKMAEVIQIERPAKAYSCDACGSNDPNCKACAAARELRAKEDRRLAQKRIQDIAGRAKKLNKNKGNAGARKPVENIEDFDSPKEWEEFQYGEGLYGNHTPPPRGTRRRS